MWFQATLPADSAWPGHTIHTGINWLLSHWRMRTYILYYRLFSINVSNCQVSGTVFAFLTRRRTEGDDNRFTTSLHTRKCMHAWPHVCLHHPWVILWFTQTYLRTWSLGAVCVIQCVSTFLLLYSKAVWEGIQPRIYRILRQRFRLYLDLVSTLQPDVEPLLHHCNHVTNWIGRAELRILDAAQHYR